MQGHELVGGGPKLRRVVGLRGLATAQHAWRLCTRGEDSCCGGEGGTRMPKKCCARPECFHLSFPCGAFLWGFHIMWRQLQCTLGFGCSITASQIRQPLASVPNPLNVFNSKFKAFMEHGSGLEAAAMQGPIGSALCVAKKVMEECRTRAYGLADVATRRRC